jgi:hypothetical protein
MGKVQRGFRLAALSWQVLREQPRLLWLPVIAALTQAIVAASYVLGVTGTSGLFHSRTHDLIVFFPLYVAMTLIGTYANAALVSVADARMRGSAITVGAGLRQATAVLPQLIGWSLLSATVGTLLRILEDRLPLAGRILATIGGIVWSIASIFVVPVLVLEGRGPRQAIGRSAKLFRARWGETLVSDGACSAAVMLVALPGLALGAVLMAGSVVLGVMVIAAVACAAFAVAGALNGIVLTAAYRFAAFGQVGSGFTEADLNLPFRSRKKDKD